MLSGEGVEAGNEDGRVTGTGNRGETGMRRVVSGREAGTGLVVMGARIDARIVTEACCDVVQFSGTAGDHASCTR